MGVILIVIGACLIIGGIAMVKKNQIMPLPEIDPEEVEVAHDVENSAEKGRAFEEYVAAHINGQYFTLKEWRGDKYSGGVYAESSTYPDMEIEFKIGNDTYLMAWECKYRSTFFKGGIDWSYPEQFERYRKFEKEKGMPVFVIIGMGGKPDNPANVYVIPLKDITTTTLTPEFMEKYRREDNKRKFFYDTKTGMLS